MFSFPEVAESRQSPIQISALDDASQSVSPRAPREREGQSSRLEALLRFQARMAVEGQEVHLARLCSDPLYACERIVAAHESADPELRRLALELFKNRHWPQPGRST